MVAQKGFIYEKNAAKYLKKLEYSDGVVAGAGSDRPDVMLTYKGKKAGCELKISPTAGGSLVLKYFEKKTPHWQFGDIDHDATEKVYLRDMAVNENILSKVNNVWKKQPFLTADLNEDTKNLLLNTSLKDRYRGDLKDHPDYNQTLSSNAMSRYYNLKNTHYINIGTHGFYLLGAKDPLGINKLLKEFAPKAPLVPTFESVAKIRARVRCQAKGVTKADALEKSRGTIGGQGYQFTFTLEFRLPQNSSAYNIAPLNKNGKSVNILTGIKGNLDCFIGK